MVGRTVWTNAESLSNGDISPTWVGMKKSNGVVEKEIVFSASQDTISDSVSSLVMKESLAVVDIEVIEEETTVYNFEVEDDHTYFVTEAEVWVHNADRSEYSKPVLDVVKGIDEEIDNKKKTDIKDDIIDSLLTGAEVAAILKGFPIVGSLVGFGSAALNLYSQGNQELKIKQDTQLLTQDSIDREIELESNDFNSRKQILEEAITHNSELLSKNYSGEKGEMLTKRIAEDFEALQDAKTRHDSKIQELNSFKNNQSFDFTKLNSYNSNISYRFNDEIKAIDDLQNSRIADLFTNTGRAKSTHLPMISVSEALDNYESIRNQNVGVSPCYSQMKQDEIVYTSCR